MKPSSWIPPVAALVVAGVWIGTQRHSISNMEKESELLQKHISEARSSLALADDSAAGQMPASKAAKDKEPPNWKKIAAQMREMQHGGGMGDMRTTIRMQKRLQAMTKQELLAALDNIATLDLTDEERQALEQMLLGPLIQKDPEVALTKYIDRMGEGRGMMGWMLGNAMSEWAKKDPAAATAWFDQQIAAGKFDSKSLDGKSAARSQFEGALINILIDSDPDAAGRRLASLPADQRGDILRSYTINELKEETQAAYAKLVRDQLPENQQVAALAQQAARLGMQDYSKASAFLDRIEATPDERIGCVARAAEGHVLGPFEKKVTTSDLDAMREWVETQAPGTADSVTGSVLAKAVGGQQKLNFAEASALAVRYQEAGGGDAVLSSFLNGHIAPENQEQARILVERISDETRRNQILESFK